MGYIRNVSWSLLKTYSIFSRMAACIHVCVPIYMYIYIYARPPPKIHLERFQSIRLENSVHLCTREKDRERAREKEGVHNKEERQREQTD